MLIIGIFASIWLLSSYYAFVIPAFFLDDKKYFSAMSTSRNVIRGRWLRTAGFFILYGIVILIIFIAIGIIQSFIAPGHIASLFAMLAQTSLQTIFGIFLYTFLFALYEDYKKQPLPEKKKK
jgi:ABC-type Fe3+ transport system permease subunit